MNLLEIQKIAEKVWGANGMYIGPNISSLIQFVELLNLLNNEKK